MDEVRLQVSSRRNLDVKVAGPSVSCRQNTPDDQACFPYERKYQITGESFQNCRLTACIRDNSMWVKDRLVLIYHFHREFVLAL